MIYNEDTQHAHGPRMTTLVFLDFEATGLLGPAQRPRITELCLLAVHRDDLLGGTGFPRVLNKLTLCLNPRKPIQMTSSQITGLYNDTLERQKDFSPATVAMINGFLSHLEEPVCLIAHYGNGYDFPLFRAELNRINQSLDGGIYCVDSLEVFRSLDCLEMAKGYTSPQPFTPANVPAQFMADYRTPEKTKPKSPPGVKRKSPEPEPLSTNEVSFKRDKSGTAANSVRRALAYGDKSKAKATDTNEVNVKTDDKVKSETFVGDDFANELLDEFGFSVVDEEELVAVAEMVEKEYLKVNKTGRNEVGKDLSGQVEASALKNANQKSNPNNGNYVFSGSGYSVLSNVNCKTTCISNNEHQDDNGNTTDKLGPSQTPSRSSNSHAPSKSNNGPSISFSDYESGDTRIRPDTDTSVVTPTKSTRNEVLCTVNPNKPGATTSFAVSGNFPPVTLISDVGSSDKGLTSPVLPGRVSPDSNSSNSDNVRVVSTPPRKSFKLIEVYRRLFGQPPPDSHRAEDDCVTLLKCAQRTKDFIIMVDKHADLFSSIKPGY